MNSDIILGRAGEDLRGSLPPAPSWIHGPFSIWRKRDLWEAGV